MSKVLDYIKNDTVMKKSDIDDMFLELFTDHVNDGELDLETIKIVALKMFLRETCKSNGMLSKTDSPEGRITKSETHIRQKA